MSLLARELVRFVFRTLYHDSGSQESKLRYVILHQLLEDLKYQTAEELSEKLKMPKKMILDTLLGLCRDYFFIVYEERQVEVIKKDKNNEEKLVRPKRKFWAVHFKKFLNFVSLKMHLMEKEAHLANRGAPGAKSGSEFLCEKCGAKYDPLQISVIGPFCKTCKVPLSSNKVYKRDALHPEVEEFIKRVNFKLEEMRKQDIYEFSMDSLNANKTSLGVARREAEVVLSLEDVVVEEHFHLPPEAVSVEEKISRSEQQAQHQKKVILSTVPPWIADEKLVAPLLPQIYSPLFIFTAGLLRKRW